MVAVLVLKILILDDISQTTRSFQELLNYWTNTLFICAYFNAFFSNIWVKVLFLKHQKNKPADFTEHQCKEGF